MLELTPRKKTVYERFLKRPFDFTIAWIALFLLTPVILLISLLVYLKLGSPVFFTQDRPGLNEKVFRMYKFRSMTNKKDCEGNFLPDSERLTKFGRFLRASSLDELPEIFNIARGEMSFVGPRPLLVEYLPLYNEKQKQRHAVRPGLTGLAQINGRNAISWEAKFDLDIKYIQKITFDTDTVIFFSTLLKVLKKDGVNSTAEISMEKFSGTQKRQEQI